MTQIGRKFTEYRPRLLVIEADRLLAPGNASVTLQTLTRAARAIGRDLRTELV